MTHRTRRPVVAGNWKMNKTPDETTSFFTAFLGEYQPHDDRTVIVFPPTLSVAAAVAAVSARTDIGLGVQNIYWEQSGAFTGEVSAAMAAAAGARYVLAGHSERRHIFGETDEQVGQKAAAALAAGLVPVICVGETLEERRAGRLQEVLLGQLDVVLNALSVGRESDEASSDDDAPLFDRASVGGTILLAYEPVWAIGTGVNATPADAAGAHAILRARLRDRFDADAAEEIPILYGGSVKPDNAGELLAAEGVDGLLVGGASLDPVGFARIAAS